MSYVELQCTSHFSFLRGASSCDELFVQASVQGHRALAITDRNSLAGIVRAHTAAKATGVRLIVGCRLDLTDGSSLLVYPTDRAAYSRLCRLLSLGKRRAGKAQCHLGWDDVADYAAGLIGILVPDEPDAVCRAQLQRMRAIFGREAHVALSLRRRPGDRVRMHGLAELAKETGVLPVVTNDVLYHNPAYRIMQDIVTCIRLNCTIDELGFRRERTADRHLLPPEEMERLFDDYPKALARSARIAERCRFSLDELKYQYPSEVCEKDLTPQQTLEKRTWHGASERYPGGIPLEIQHTLHHELNLIGEMGYAAYFLTVDSIVNYARSQEILCQGRGSAANSAVCYVLGITSIDPCLHGLLFERFISQERREPPDIDVDFEHQRREDVIQWIFDTYGRDRAALTATVIRYRSKGALRDVGKALGMPEDLLKGLSQHIRAWSHEGVEERHARDLNLNLDDRRLQLVMQLSKALIGTPRHLSQHPGGFVLTDQRLDELVPIEPAAMDDRQIIEWDKDDIDALRFMKVDVLGLGMLSCLKRGLDMLQLYKGIDKHDLSDIEHDDEPTFEMIRRADTLGTFQIESRAQMASLPRTLPVTYYDLVIQVAIVRPGPIQGDMVHPYLRRKNGKEKPTYPTPALEKVLSKTLGVPLFQEQAMRVAIECAGFTPGEADELRRSMGTFKHTGGVSHLRDKLMNGMIERGQPRDFAERLFSQLEGFGSYGFPESHAASFARLAYVSCWLKCHHPDVFCAALLNAQPLGFYAPAQIVRDAREHGVEVRPVCLNASRWDCELEPTGGNYFAVRLGMRLVKGLSENDAARLVVVRGNTPYASVDECWRRASVPVKALRCLAEADAFLPSLGLARREAIWAIKALRDETLPLFAAADARANRLQHEIIEPAVTLKPMSGGREVVEDYRHISMSLRAHPLSFLRDELARQGFMPCGVANTQTDKTPVLVTGMVLVRQKPGSAKGVMFMTLEDESGISNVVIWPSLYEKYRALIFTAGMIGIRGVIQREGAVVHLVAREMIDHSAELASIGEAGLIHHPVTRGDSFMQGGGPDPRDGPPPLQKSRDIYVPTPQESIRVQTRDFR